ncbi:MAG: glutamine synthetase family protein [Intestinimonas sp.]|nr:glutamine synthetase family protein [Intestinimonas sp.]
MKDKFTKQEILTFSEIEKMIQDKGIEMLRLEYTDLLGVQRGKLLPVEMLDEIKDGVAFCAASMGMEYDNSILSTDYLPSTSNDMTVIPDPSTFTPLPFANKTAVMLGDVYYNGAPMRVSPRGFLKQVVDEYFKMGYDPIAACELEFFVYKKDANGAYVPYTNQNSNCYTANERTDPKNFLYQITDTFKHMDYNVLFMNHEYFPGQYEYNWKHASAVRAADESSLFKELCKDIAEMNDMMVTFMAKPKGAGGGSGCHFHLSLNDLETGKNICDDQNGEDGISDTLRYMIGGILKHGCGMSAFLAPTVNCYKRYQPDSFAPIYLGWGMDNRTSYVRIPRERGKGARLEVRAASAACNPYLGLGAILAAALDGIKNKIEPPAKIITDLYHDKVRQGECGTVPRSLFRAVNELQNDEWFSKQFSPELTELFSSMKMYEVEQYKKSVTDWEMDTYSYHV